MRTAANDLTGLEPQAREAHGEQRPEHRAPVVERLPEAIGGAATLRRHEIGDERVPRGPTDALADPVEQTSGEHRHRASGEGEERLDQRGEAVADDHRDLAPGEPVTQGAGDELEPGRDDLGEPFDEPDEEARGAQ